MRCSLLPRWLPLLLCLASCLSPPMTICSLLPAPRVWRPRIQISTLEENKSHASAQPMLDERALDACPADLDVELAFRHDDAHGRSAFERRDQRIQQRPLDHVDWDLLGAVDAAAGELLLQL